jgi:hypothetical protein
LSFIVISWGWEPLAFYRGWGGFPKTAKDAKGMKGPALAPLNTQSPLAPALLELAENMLFSSPDYVERIKRHYAMFRGKIDGRRRGQGKNTSQWPSITRT